jgi:RES domain-containing protein
LLRNTPINWLYASGAPNRYNPAGVLCVYFSKSKEVADVELAARFRRTKGEFQPVTRFYAELSLSRVLDLTDPKTLKSLSIDTRSLSRNWRLARRPTITQLLGLAVNQTQLFSAIQYPSEQAAKSRLAGSNIVIFKNCVKAPDHVRILGADSRPLEEWP